MKLSTEQKSILEALGGAHESLVLKRTQAKRRAQEIVNAELETCARIQSNLANDALAAGITKSQIGLAMGTRDWNLINRTIDLTREEHEAKAEIVKPKDRWVWDEDARTVTLYKWGGTEFFSEEETGEVVARMVFKYDRWSRDLTQEVPKAIAIELGQYIEPVLNAEASTQPVVPPVPDLSAEAFTYRAWTPEDDEKDGSEW